MGRWVGGLDMACKDRLVVLSSVIEIEIEMEIRISLAVVSCSVV